MPLAPRLLLLIAAALACSAFSFRCMIFCSEQTGIQTDYTGQRDDCRDFAQTKLEDMEKSMATLSDKDRKSKLVSLFSECMGKHGWTVPDGKPVDRPGTPTSAPATGLTMQPPPAPTAIQPNNAAPIAPAPSPAPAAQATTASPANTTTTITQTAPAAQPATPENEASRRTAECNFARYSADHSAISAARAQACDVECAEGLKIAPAGSQPPACPPDVAAPR